MGELLFLDESGYTGEDLLNADQPVFVIATLRLSEARCAELRAEFFSDVQAPEVKHSLLRKYARGQRSVVEFVRALAASEPGAVKYHVAHKRYDLTGQMVEWLVDPVVHRMGKNLYHRGGNIAMSNMMYYGLPSFGGAAFFDDLLIRFQAMMLTRDHDDYRRFFHLVFNPPLIIDQLEDLLTFFRRFDRHPEFGFQFIRKLHPRPFGIPLSHTMVLMGSWRDAMSKPFVLVHDASSTMAREKWMWDALVNPNVAPTRVGSDRRVMEFPLMVQETRFERSESWAGLQLADVLAGALAHRLRCHVREDLRDEYGRLLADLNTTWDVFEIQSLWPRPEVDPNELGTDGGPEGLEDAIKHAGRLVAAVRTRR